MKNKKTIVLSGIIIIIIAIIAGFMLQKTVFVKDSITGIEFKHEFGTTIAPINPKSVISFDFGLLDTLDTLGANIIGLPKETLPKYLSKFAGDEYVDLGALKEPDFEKIFELKPELIIITGRQKDLYQDFANLAPTLYLPTNNSDYMQGFEENNRILGEIFEQSELVEGKIAEVQSIIKEIEIQVTANNSNALIAMSNNGDISSYGETSRFGIIHKYMGFKTVDEIPDSGHGNGISYEYILDKNPDYIFVIDRAAVAGGDISAEKTFSNDIIKSTNAYKNDNIVYLDSFLWYTSPGGLYSTKMMAQEILANL